MSARVFHFNLQPGKSYLESREQAHWPRDYRLVAVVEEACSRESAFTLTNSIDDYWWKNEDILVFSPEHVAASGERGWRSTSVGDVVEVQGEYFKCLDHGWERV